MIDLELSDKPEVHQIASMLQLDPDTVVGKLVRVWSWFDKQTVDGHAPSVTVALLDRITVRDGFAEAMVHAGWLDKANGGLRMPKFDRWNGQSAKKRALAYRRQAKKRNVDVTPTSRTQRDKSVTREDKRNITTPIPPSGAFLRFWGSWPKGERKRSQGKCWELWQRKDYDQVAESVLSHVEVLKASEGWRKGYVPAPLVYLNQRQWEGAEMAPAQERTVAL
jgi:hypothetical protein